MRPLYIIVFMLLTSLVYGQKSVLLKNRNLRAKELKHYLNESQDSIIFKGERTIYEIMIYNSDFERVVKVKTPEAKIIISDIPIGRYAVEAVLRDKLIIVTLLRTENFNLIQSSYIVDNDRPERKSLEDLNIPLVSKAKTIETPNEELINTLVTKKSESLNSENTLYQTNLGLSGKRVSPAKKEVKVKSITKKASTTSKTTTSKYWVSYKINSGTSSEKTLKMADQATVDRIIRKIKIDMRTTTGRLNELTVWEVFNPSDFAKHKRKHKKNYMNIDSNSFNKVPYFKVEHE
ncbi:MULTISPECIES: hypothetical protein [Winogradskyella]|uniref:hypothetical protein n=1 Tax=Winogradskyella TaxID=286104 RepID=UPI0015CBA629|nr:MULTISPECIES: hypothetical protein [Winogradskyella]QXP77744.1 hypothetical protein H0I32_10955 [Winogradskyella sp. HaHa_3_26]